jgi:hypothetical protein
VNAPFWFIENGRLSQAFFNIQVEIHVIGGTEIVIHRKHVVSLAGQAIWIGGGITQASGDPGENGPASGLRRRPVVAIAAVTIHRIPPNRIIFQAIRRADRRAKIQERIHVDLVVVKAESAAYHKTAAGAVSQTDAGSKVVIIRLINVGDALSLNF